MIHLLDRNKIIPLSVNKLEIHHTLSKIAKFNSLSMCLMFNNYKLNVTQSVSALLLCKGTPLFLIMKMSFFMTKGGKICTMCFDNSHLKESNH